MIDGFEPQVRDMSSALILLLAELGDIRLLTSSADLSSEKGRETHELLHTRLMSENGGEGGSSLEGSSRHQKAPELSMRDSSAEGGGGLRGMDALVGEEEEEGGVGSGPSIFLTAVFMHEVRVLCLVWSSSCALEFGRRGLGCRV